MTCGTHTVIPNNTRAARILPAPTVTRSGYLFRADASPFVPSVALPVIHEGSGSSDSDDEDTAKEPPTPAAPQKQPAPYNRFLAPATSASTASAPIPPYEDAAATISTAAPQPLRRSQRNRHQPDWLTTAYLQAPQGRAPVPGSSAYATFPYPVQTVIPTFPPVLPDIGPDPVTYLLVLVSSTRP